MFGCLTLLATGLASVEAPAPMLEADWTRDTIPAIAVHLSTATGRRPLAGVRVVLRGPDGTSFESITGSDGATTRGFLTPGTWEISVQSPQHVTQTVWVDLPPRQRADLRWALQPGAAADSEPVLHAPVVDTSRAARGATFRMGTLVARAR